MRLVNEDAVKNGHKTKNRLSLSGCKFPGEQKQQQHRQQQMLTNQI